MIKQMDTKEYREAWREAERKSVISRFQTSVWDLDKSKRPESKGFAKSDFIEALRKAAQPIENPKPSPESS